MTKLFTRQNLRYLVQIFGSQSELARLLYPGGPTQPQISAILGNSRRSRRLHPHEEANMELRLGIPHGFISGCDLKKARSLVARYRMLPKDAQDVVNDILKFSRSSAE